MQRQWQTENPGKVPTKEGVELLQKKTKGKAPHSSIRNYLSTTRYNRKYASTLTRDDRAMLRQWQTGNPGPKPGGGGQQEVDVGRQGRG